MVFVYFSPSNSLLFGIMVFFVTRKFFKGEQMEWQREAQEPEDQNSFHFE